MQFAKPVSPGHRYSWNVSDSRAPSSLKKNSSNTEVISNSKSVAVARRPSASERRLGRGTPSAVPRSPDPVIGSTAPSHSVTCDPCIAAEDKHGRGRRALRDEREPDRGSLITDAVRQILDRGNDAVGRIPSGERLAIEYDRARPRKQADRMSSAARSRSRRRSSGSARREPGRGLVTSRSSFSPAR